LNFCNPEEFFSIASTSSSGAALRKVSCGGGFGNLNRPAQAVRTPSAMDRKSKNRRNPGRFRIKGFFIGFRYPRLPGLRKMPESPAACGGDEWQVLAFFVKDFKGFHPSNSPKKELKIWI
jgi:hypothetical protein